MFVFLRSEAKFLGRIIDGEGMRPDPEAKAKVQDWEAPRNKCEMSSFLGFANYYRELIQDYATKSHPLASLVRKNITYRWTEAAQKAFDEVKTALTSAQTLALPTEHGLFVLDTDASNVGIAGILHQEQEWKGRLILRPVYYGINL